MNLQQLLAGKKTYLLALAAILYLLGAHLGWWPLDDKILDALGFGGLITLRAAVRKSEANVSEYRRDGVSERPSVGETASSDTPTPRNSETRLPAQWGDETEKRSVGETAIPDTPTRRLPDTRASILAFCLLPLALLTGCASVGSNPAADAQRIQRLATIAELAAFTGTQYWLGSHPQDRPYFALSLAALDSLLKDRNYDPQALSTALSGLPVRQLQGDKGALIVSAATILYDGYANEVVNLDQAVYIAPVISAIRNGLFRALNPGQVLQTATTPPPLPPKGGDPGTPPSGGSSAPPK